MAETSFNYHEALRQLNLNSIPQPTQPIQIQQTLSHPTVSPVAIPKFDVVDSQLVELQSRKTNRYEQII
jgi:hypothetical protein